jgi:hypothetical protein
MHRIAVFVDDYSHARHVLGPHGPAASQRTEWIVLTCPPRLPIRIARWLNPEQRARYQERWAQTVRAELQATFSSNPTNSVTWLIPNKPLSATLDGLRATHGSALRTLDARRSNFGRASDPLVRLAHPNERSDWGLPVAVASSLSAMLALTD